MKIVLITHPLFLPSKSMPRFANMLATGFTDLGHDVTICSPKPIFYHFAKILPKTSKWLGYIDQYLLFPFVLTFIKFKFRNKNTIFVFSDQALGPLVPVMKNRPHAIHVHDLLALKSALGKEKINSTSFTGKIYQKYIRKGFEAGKVFIPISTKTKEDLECYSSVEPRILKVVFNGLNYSYNQYSKSRIISIFDKINLNVTYKNYLFNIGGNQWYKNRVGLFCLYKEYALLNEKPLPLILVGPKAKPSEESLINEIKKINKHATITFLKDIDDVTLNALYSGARCLIFPSHEEGFGWPIIESQASGTCVLTTNQSPMNEIAGRHTPLLTSTVDFRNENIAQWALKNTTTLIDFLNLNTEDRKELENKGVEWSKNFNSKIILQQYLKIYKESIELFG
ncbi:MAG: glycosyltransferase [Paraglaciecola sp.]|uniref:glycosyltransferase n=1 Tax=Paraglaciecola sp. TaxID=1920173 RepID=UPI0032992748